MRTAKTLIRLGRCPGWSESSLDAHSLCWFCHVAANIVSNCVTERVNDSVNYSVGNKEIITYFLLKITHFWIDIESALRKVYKQKEDSAASNVFVVSNNAIKSAYQHLFWKSTHSIFLCRSVFFPRYGLSFLTRHHRGWDHIERKNYELNASSACIGCDL